MIVAPAFYATGRVERPDHRFLTLPTDILVSIAIVEIRRHVKTRGFARMSQLYTVRMFRKQFVYSYDDRGRRCNEREESIEVVVSDLPHVTALGYQFKFPKNGVTITRQEVDAGDIRPRYSAKRDYYERDDSPAPASSEDTPAHSSTVDAAIRGDLGAALSTEAA